MLNNKLLSDVEFVVPKLGSNETKKTIAAHKFILSISSAVFFAMFYSEMAETQAFIIELPDCHYESLLEFFRYLYSDEVHLSADNVMEVLYLAKKYMVPSLTDKCTKYLCENLDGSNVFCVLPLAIKFEENDLLDHCWKVVDNQAREAVKSEHFAKLERSLVEMVVKRDSLQVKEVELFEAIDGWATKECERQGLTPDGGLKRQVLGEEIVTAIRFPMMSQKGFASVVLDSDILSKKEIVDMVKHFSGVLIPSDLKFLTTRRSGLFARCRRFNEYDMGWNYDTTDDDYIRFSVSEAIHLFGVRLFGSEGNKYIITLNLNPVTINADSLAIKSGVFLSEKDETDEHYGFDVLFDLPVGLAGGKIYELIASIKGPPSWHGERGNAAVQCSGVICTFTNSAFRCNGTTALRGQFHDLLRGSVD